MLLCRCLLLIPLLLWASLEPAADSTAGLSAADREIAVWSDLINHGLDDHTKMIVLAELTSGDAAGLARDPATIAEIILQMKLPPSLFADWVRRNATTELIERPLKLAVSYQVLNAKTRAELFDVSDPAASWKLFFTRFAGAPGLLRVSHAGFDDAMGHALVYLEQVCGADCGAGHLFHLARDEHDHWVVQDDVTVWMVK